MKVDPPAQVLEEKAGSPRRQDQPPESGQPSPILVSFSRDERPGQLPSATSRLIGRTAELDDICGLVTRNRLVTLTGPGGVGKTVLALEVARRCAVDFADGAVFVSLAPVRDPSLLIPAVARAIGLPRPDSIVTADNLAERLGDAQLLLVLDNLEQIVEGATAIAAVLHSCPHIKVLATSRVLLRVHAEIVFQVAPLSLPVEGRPASIHELLSSAAVELFVERASAFDASFRLNEENIAAVGEICARLDGLPLAIELAAARVRILPPAALLSMIEHRLPLLTGGPRDAPARQQTLRNTVAWSCNLLSRSERQLFRRLSIFVGGFTLDAAAAVHDPSSVSTRARPPSTAVIDMISTLSDHALIRKIDGAGESRFGMLETIREYGLECLAADGELSLMRRRQSEWVAKWVEGMRPAIESPNGTAALRQYELEHPNILAALAYAVETGATELGYRIVAFVSPFWMVRTHYQEGFTWSNRILQLSGNVPASLRMEVLYAAADFATDIGDFDSALSRIAEGRELGRASANEALEAKMVFLLGIIESSRGRYEEAVANYEHAISLSNRLPSTDEIDSQVRSFMRLGRAEIAVAQGDLERAKRFILEADDIFRGTRDSWGLAITRENMATVRMLEGEYQNAATAYLFSLADYREIGDLSGVANCITGLAIAAARMNRYTCAAKLFSAAESVRTKAGGLIAAILKASQQKALEETKSQLGERRFEAAWQRGADFSLEHVIDEGTLLSQDDPRKLEVPFGLTQRQIEILHLIAAGRTDREIADELFISYRTVTSHVQNILNQMGVDSRTAASTEAVRLDLI